jgi:hypothetical protein
MKHVQRMVETLAIKKTHEAHNIDMTTPEKQGAAVVTKTPAKTPVLPPTLPSKALSFGQGES